MTTYRRTSSAQSRIVVTLLAFLIASPAIANEQPSWTWRAGSRGYLRSAPSGQSPIVASVPRGAMLTSLQPCAKGWCAVEYKGVRGWTYGVFVAEKPDETTTPAHAAEPLAKASLQRPSPAPSPSAKGRAGASYRVIGLGGEESLPVRKAPFAAAQVVNALSPATNDIAGLETCTRRWCFIEHNGVRGFVRTRFLARSDEASAPKYGVDGEPNLKVFSFASPDAEIIGEIPFYAEGIAPVGECSGQWCHVRYLGLVGFVDTHRLRPQTSPKG